MIGKQFSPRSMTGGKNEGELEEFEVSRRNDGWGSSEHEQECSKR